ncbi:hypothetical protein BJV82DRAFT_237435 [Fennellomyces sp. T-0311]|nr:hypothetical protein BJV82DRAFT_237435 [Fennellomyces sp. T-0311]
MRSTNQKSSPRKCSSVSMPHHTLDEFYLDCQQPGSDIHAAINVLDKSQLRRLYVQVGNGVSEKDIDAFASLSHLEYLCLCYNHTALVKKITLIKILEKSQSTRHLTVVLNGPRNSSGFKGSRSADLSGRVMEELEDLEALYKIEDLKEKPNVATKQLMGEQYFGGGLDGYNDEFDDYDDEHDDYDEDDDDGDSDDFERKWMNDYAVLRAMRTCSACGYRNYPGHGACPDCGFS